MPSLSEARTRIDLIEPALKKAGWDVHDPDQVGIEIPVDGFDPQAWKALEAQLNLLRETGEIYGVQLPEGVSDYALYRPNGEIAAIVEAKRTSIDPRLAEAQTGFYVTEIEKRQSLRPFAFMTNGHDVYFWDVGRAHKRLVAGFFSPADMENLLYLRENQTPLAAVPIHTAITNQSYQQEAVRRVCEAFEGGKRRALIVMATGTGKTRVAMSLQDILMAVRGDGSTATRIGLVNSPDLVGANISPNLLRFKVDEQVMNPLYLFTLMTCEGGQRLLGRHVTRTAKKTITAGDVKRIKAPLPPLSLQQQFAHTVHQFERLRAQQREAERQAEHLSQTLLHRAFRGELQVKISS